MGRASRTKTRAINRATRITREPLVPSQDWPRNHIETRQSPEHIEECIEVVIHGVKHYLHSASAQALVGSLTETLIEWETMATKELGRPPFGWEYMVNYLTRVISGKGWNRWTR